MAPCGSRRTGPRASSLTLAEVAAWRAREQLATACLGRPCRENDRDAPASACIGSPKRSRRSGGPVQVDRDANGCDDMPVSPTKGGQSHPRDLLSQIASMNEGSLSSPCASVGRSVPARGGRPAAWSPTEFGPDGDSDAMGRGWGGRLERCSCLYRFIKLRGPGVIGARSGGARQLMDCQAVRRFMAPAGAKGLNGWLRVSMYQIASVSLRASSIWATLAPRWRPSRRLVRW